MDHFFWNEGISDSIVYADVLHLPENTSDHCPIYCLLNVENISHPKDSSSTIYEQKLCWNKATSDQKEIYKKNLEDCLKSIAIPTHMMQCHDVHCLNACHNDDNDEMLCTIIENIKTSAESSIPMSKQRCQRKNKVPISRWNEEVQPFKENAKFWHSIWESAGRPINTVLHGIMKKTRNVYHYQIRKNKKIVEILKRNRLLDACINDKGDIFQEIKKLRRAAPTVSTNIDGVTTNIENHFAGIYKSLYNSVEDQEQLKSIRDKINNGIEFSSVTNVLQITPSLVNKAIHRLKNSKNDPVCKFSSDCLKNAPSILSEHLAMIFKNFLIHGHISSFLMVSTLIPLVKDKLGNICSSSNYRSIALSSLILKIFDWVFLLMHDEKLDTDELQFGFQQKISTSMCTWLAVETIDYFQRHNSDVFSCVMDMTKAFDNVKHSTLFEKLIDKGIPLIYIRLLMKMYEKQVACVLWNGSISDIFSIGNGVKQGAVLSPILYCIYINDVFKALRRKKTGCWVDDTYIGILGYADDLLLLSPTLDGLQEMVKTCEDFANTHTLTFSTHPDANKCKTKCLAFLKKERPLKNILLCGNELPWVKTVKHLGCKISSNIQGLHDDLMEKRAIYINRVNELLQEFYYADPLTRVKINNIFNTSFYGSQLWDLFSEESTRLEKTWNISQRKIMGIPRNTHRYFIEPLTETKHIQLTLTKRFLNFIHSVYNSKKIVLRKMLSLVKYDCRSTTGSNMRNIMKRVNKVNVDEVTINYLKHHVYLNVPAGDEWKVNFAKELIQRNNIGQTENKDMTEILNFILT